MDAELAAEIAAGLPPATLWRQAEARLLAQRVAELIDGGGVRAGEVVVLLRAGGDLEVYERALQLRGLRTLAAAGGFWAHQQIGDLLAYLRVLANPLDEEALYGALASPLVGLSRDALALLAAAAREAGIGAWETRRGARRRAAARCAGASRSARRWSRSAHGSRASARARSRRAISELIERAVDSGGYRERVLAMEWGERRLANVHKLLRLARAFEASEGRDLRGFLDHAARLQAAGGARESDAPVEGVEPDAVRLMSIHAAKGLEFPVVCVADLGRAINDCASPICSSTASASASRCCASTAPRRRRRSTTTSWPGARKQAEAEEEERILYVAMTRARERLLLSGAVELRALAGSGPRGHDGLVARAGAVRRDRAARARRPPAVHDLAVGAARVRLRISSAAVAGEVLTRGSMSVEAPRVPSYLQGAGALERDAERRPPQRARGEAGGRAGGAQLHVAERARALRLPLLPGTRARHRRGSQRRARRGPRRAARGTRAGTLVHVLLERLDFRAPRVRTA